MFNDDKDWRNGLRVRLLVKNLGKKKKQREQREAAAAAAAAAGEGGQGGCRGECRRGCRGGRGGRRRGRGRRGRVARKAEAREGKVRLPKERLLAAGLRGGVQGEQESRGGPGRDRRRRSGAAAGGEGEDGSTTTTAAKSTESPPRRGSRLMARTARAGFGANGLGRGNACLLPVSLCSAGVPVDAAKETEERRTTRRHFDLSEERDGPLGVISFPIERDLLVWRRRATSRVLPRFERNGRAPWFPRVVAHEIPPPLSDAHARRTPAEDSSGVPFHVASQLSP